MTDKLRVGFIGAGRIADLHALGYRDQADAELYAVCDSDGGRAAKRTQEWGGRYGCRRWGERPVDHCAPPVYANSRRRHELDTRTC